ncbi:MAG: glycosyl hydrolase family 65 protein [Gemmatimonadaceae bacterium]
MTTAPRNGSRRLHRARRTVRRARPAGPLGPAGRCTAALALCAAAHLGAPRALGAQAPLSDPAFLLTARTPDRSPSPFLGNGRLGGPISAHGTAPAPAFLAGLFEEARADVPRIAAIPAWNVVDVHDGARWLNAQPATPGTLADYQQTVDMRTGTVHTSYEWVDGDRRTGVAVEAFVSRAEPRLAAVRVRVVPRYTGRMRVQFPLSGWAPPRRLALGTLERADPAWRPADVWYPGHVVVRGRRATALGDGGEVTLTGTPEGRGTVVAEVAAVSWPHALAGLAVDTGTTADGAAVGVAFDAAAGRAYTFEKVVGVVAAADSAAARASAARVARAGRARGYDALRAASAAAWGRRWETDIQLDGDPALQRVVRALLFQLLCSADSGTALGIAPMGLSSAGYYGHVFWDSDTWMFPALVLTHPDVARSLVSFRARTLDAARGNARANGRQGAMYPWEADERGHETTPRFAIQNARSEIHVNGDVALAAWQYYLATGDSAWLAREGFPVIRGTADFWVSRATHDAARGRYHIRDVVSVDEGLVGVSDDAYTNAVARRNLETAAAAARRLGRRPDERWAAVATGLNLAFDSARGTYRTYEGAPDSTLGSVTALLSYPLAMPMAAGVKRTNLQHAVDRALREPAGAMMGGTLLSVVAAELGERALVDTLLPASYDGYLKGPFLMISETPTNDAVSFVTGAGGFLQQVIYGYTGLRLRDAGLVRAFRPLLPSRITRLTLRNIHARGRRYDAVVEHDSLRMIPRETGRPARPRGKRAPATTVAPTGGADGR